MPQPFTLAMDSRLYLRSDAFMASHEKEMLEMEVCKEGIDIMISKMRHIVFMVRGMDPRAANILKQEMLAADGEAAIPYHAISDLSKPTDCLVSGTQRQFQIAIAKLVSQPFGLRELAQEISQAINNLDRPRPKPAVMGILNITPDSFSDGGRYFEKEDAVEHARAMADQGADIIDIGGESTRPGAEPVPPEEQLSRVIPVIKALDFNREMSIDSRSPVVLKEALESGAGIANLVGGVNQGLLEVLASSDCRIVLMHMQGQPANMQNSPEYADVMDDIVDWFRGQMAMCLDAGISNERLIIDPGIGFGKTLEHNLEILRRLGELRLLGLPIMVGTSRKSFIGKLLDSGVEERLEGSIASAVIALANGADIIRAHDVKETVRAIRIAQEILNNY